VIDDRGDDLQEQGVSPQDEPAYAQRPGQRTLGGIVEVIREDGHNQSGVWALLPPEIYYDAGGDLLTAELPTPTLDLERQTLHKIRRLQDGFTQNGILILNIHDPSDHERWANGEKKTFWLGFNSRPALGTVKLGRLRADCVRDFEPAFF